MRYFSFFGHEGAATRNDKLVGIYTRWLAPDGRPMPSGSPLPEGLDTGGGADYGLTGRLNLIESNALVGETLGRSLEDVEITLTREERDGCSEKPTLGEQDRCLETLRLQKLAEQPPGQGARTAEFAIGPGEQLQVVQLNDDINDVNEHFYITVFGRALGQEGLECPQEECVDTDQNTGLIAGRPNRYTPFYVPRYHERDTLEEQLERNRQQAESRNTTSHYEWMLRPEYQFSLVDLTVKEINAVRTVTRENGEEIEEVRNLLDAENPYISGSDDLVRIFNELILPSDDPLPSADGPRDYVFAVGEEEVGFEAGSDEPLEFTSLAHLNYLFGQLGPSEFVTARIYLNNDPSNVLWQWAFGNSGLQVTFDYPGGSLGLPEVKSQENQSEDETGYYVLGGARVRINYNFPYGSTPQSLKITAGVDGRVCSTFYQKTEDCPQESAGETIGEWEATAGITAEQANEEWFVYWQPILNSDDEWALGLDTNLTVELVYESVDGETVRYVENANPDNDEEGVAELAALTPWIRNRELGPESVAGEAPKGSDVAILETMLWQLGISPQWGWPGKSATRIDAISREYTADEKTRDCGEELAKARDEYSGGYEGRGPQSGSGATLCERREASIGAMVKRFRARHYTPVGNNNYAGPETIANQKDLVDSKMLGTLMNRWHEYGSAYSQHIGDGLIVDPAPEWLNDAVEIWQSGLENKLSGEVLVPATYTLDKHKSVLQDAGVISGGDEVPAEYVRAQLLQDWAVREISSHWGEGDPQTDYRISEGAADEYGSMSYNQLIYTYRYSDRPCTVHGELAMNYFEPTENLKGFVVHTAARTDNVAIECGGAFWEAYHENGLQASYESSDLKGYLDGDGDFHSIGAAEDQYEIFGKAVGLYNGAGGILTSSNDWAHILKNRRYTSEFANGNTSTKCYSCGYAVDVKNDHFGLPYRAYVWKGGEYPDFYIDENGDQQPHPKAGEEWCFVYGEEEWRDPESRTDGENAQWNDYRNFALADEARRVSCE